MISSFSHIQVKRFSLNTISRNLSSNRNELTAVRNGFINEHRIIATAKMSVEGDVLVKEAVGTDQKNGTFLTHLQEISLVK